MEDCREGIRQAVWSLRESERELIVLRYFNGFSQAQISEVLNIYLKRNGLTGDNHEKS
jgi:DNA-directed RNA polymerase specialized sigma24 family protein